MKSKLLLATTISAIGLASCTTVPTIERLEKKVAAYAEKENWDAITRLAQTTDCTEAIPSYELRFWDNMVSVKDSPIERSILFIPATGETSDVTKESGPHEAVYDAQELIDRTVRERELWEIHLHPRAQDRQYMEDITSAGFTEDEARRLLPYFRTESNFIQQLPSPQDVLSLANNYRHILSRNPEAQIRRFITYPEGWYMGSLEYSLTEEALSEVKDILAREIPEHDGSDFAVTMDALFAEIHRPMDILEWETDIVSDYSSHLQTYLEEQRWAEEGYYTADLDDFINHINDNSQFVRVQRYPETFLRHVCFRRLQYE